MTNRNNSINVPEARSAMDRFKMEAASEVGVNLKDGYNGDLTSREAGSVGGQMVKKMIEAYEQQMQQKKTVPFAGQSFSNLCQSPSGCGAGSLAEISA